MGHCTRHEIDCLYKQTRPEGQGLVHCVTSSKAEVLWSSISCNHVFWNLQVDTCCMQQVNLTGDSLTSSRVSALRVGIRCTPTPWIIHYLAGMPCSGLGCGNSASYQQEHACLGKATASLCRPCVMLKCCLQISSPQARCTSASARHCTQMS